jgi:hypothetical protein
MAKSYSFLFVALCSALLVKGQKLNLKQEWIGQNLEYLKLDSTHATFQFSHRFGYRDKKGYHILKDTLRLQDWFGSSQGNYKTLSHRDYDFLIKREKRSFTLIPINKAALEISGNRRKIAFVKRNTIYNKDVRLDSLHFTTTTCYGTCPEFSLRLIKKQLEFIGGKHAIKQGRYTAILSDSLYNVLAEVLKGTALDRIVNYPIEITDVPYTRIAVYYNGKKHMIEGYETPMVADKLHRFLLALPSLLEKTLK